MMQVNSMLDVSALFLQMIMVFAAIVLYGGFSAFNKGPWFWFIIANLLILLRRMLSFFVGDSIGLSVIIDILLNMISVSFLIFVLQMRKVFEQKDD